VTVPVGVAPAPVTAAVTVRDESVPILVAEGVTLTVGVSSAAVTETVADPVAEE
jgi:hypothetical protein